MLFVEGRRVDLGRPAFVALDFALEEGRSLHSVDHHQVFTTLRHGQILCSAFLEELMKALQLFVLGNQIVNIIQLELCDFSNFNLVLSHQANFFVLLSFAHGCTDLVLVLKGFHLGVVAPEHHFEGALFRQSFLDPVMEVIKRKFVLRQEELDIVLESFLLFLVLPVFE